MLAQTDYNFSWLHASLRLAATETSGQNWSAQMPAMIAGVTGQVGNLSELLRFRVPP